MSQSKVLKLALSFLTITFFLSAVATTEAAQPPQVDSECVSYIAKYHVDTPGINPPCNTTCAKSCIDSGAHCPFGDPNTCQNIDLSPAPGDSTFDRVNIFGVDFGPVNRAVPRIIRIALFGFFAVIGLFAIIYGFYGLYVRSTALDNAEKAEEAEKIFSGVYKALVLAFGGILFSQVLALLTGLEGNIYTFNFFPSLSEVDIPLDEDAIQNAICQDGQTGLYAPTSGGVTRYVCYDSRWVTPTP